MYAMFNIILRDEYSEKMLGDYQRSSLMGSCLVFKQFKHPLTFVSQKFQSVKVSTSCLVASRHFLNGKAPNILQSSFKNIINIHIAYMFAWEVESFLFIWANI